MLYRESSACCGEPKEAVESFLSAGTWPMMLFLVESLSESVGRLKPLSRHQPTFGLGRANESHLHSSLANKSPIKFCFLVLRSFWGRYIFMGIYKFLPSRETSPFPLIKSGVIFTTKHLTSSHLSKTAPVRHGLGRACKPWRARSRALTQFLLWL